MESVPAKPDREALADLVAAIDEAVESQDPREICRGVERALQDAIAAGTDLLPPAYLEPAGDHYARRLLHRDPAGRYTMIAMTWGPGQGTPLHDHGDSWGTVCVYTGRVRVTPYDLLATPAGEGGAWRFRPNKAIDAGRGAADSVIPPADFHTIENPFETTAISIHVYKGEMGTAGIYLPAGEEGEYRHETKALSYDA